MKLLIIVTCLLIFVGTAIANEAYYRDVWCSSHNGITEFINDDRTRVDCLTSEYAVEVDYAKKWYEAVGQSLHYGLKTGKKPGILLIIKTDKDMKYYHRLVNAIEYYSLPIRVWVIK